jgi:hypothetical protein
MLHRFCIDDTAQETKCRTPLAPSFVRASHFAIQKSFCVTGYMREKSNTTGKSISESQAVETICHTPLPSLCPQSMETSTTRKDSNERLKSSSHPFSPQTASRNTSQEALLVQQHTAAPRPPSFVLESLASSGHPA